MNADHGDSLVLLARTLGGRVDVTEAAMTAVDRYGFDLVVDGPGGRAALRLGFEAPVATPAAVRPAMIRLVERARRAAGEAVPARGQRWVMGCLVALVAALSIATAFVFPLLVIVLRLWVLVPLLLRRPVPLLAPVMRLLRWVLRWSMVEVFMLGVLIAVVRSAGVTHVVLGPGIFAYLALTVLLTAIHAAGLQGLWREASRLRP